MSVAHKLLCRVSSDSPKKMPAKQPEDILKAFIAEDPDSRYTFHSERNATESELCREGKEKSRKCIMLHMQATKMFATMQVCSSAVELAVPCQSRRGQAQGFFCALPLDPTRTHMECKRMPKS
ncbi:hypothetical protein B0H21DRAFT_275728 [Amylocystis lapponica]|nr:hypothetical protein B0H21DRAFT_275728 [Amylocystis lapponica]